MLAWYHDTEQLMQLPHMSLSQRETFIASHATEDVLDRQRHSGSSSPGLDEDEADEVPYSRINSIEETTPRSPIRPPPGGSFPSETHLDAAAMYVVVVDIVGPEAMLPVNFSLREFQERRMLRRVMVRMNRIDLILVGRKDQYVIIGVSRLLQLEQVLVLLRLEEPSWQVNPKTTIFIRNSNRGDIVPSTGPHEAAAYDVGTAMNQSEPSQLESTGKQFSSSRQSYSLTVNKSNIHPK